ncbi:3'(2'),5'-bisphosphate nucleotidase CysQ [Marinomonas gallaica]|uniref:3'(2'),5'-bisphosphate nucleotidase CysQ n=1 Tax=Marinomonas gallaica TaxID=1806667 RepID=A0A1C3JUY8_9GAMM|nr:3'(2'),5'-bisphosphate nucleotidase CysQ [Marinomonas gallaica]SBT18935.1 3'(2'),5'-bisphosphate nucleotidase CysQ [Marinomonas gallaica]SBT21890.1 3'(2'),5'-bisphosphate nucleotidase CysQ [Marinomonas gallaica]
MKMDIEQINTIAMAAGAAIMEVYDNGDFSVDFKSDESPLTAADKAAHITIVEQLAKLTPDMPILSEEAVEAFSGANENGEYWLVDPLDGTKEFIKRNGEFTVNIALIRSGKPVLGVVYAPAIDTLYYAEESAGAFKRVGRDQAQAISVESHSEDSPWRVVGSRSHASQETLDYLTQIEQYEMVPMGSSLKLCLVAEGRADLYPRFGLTSLWDTAAAHAVVLASGGEVVTPEGKPLDYSNTEQMLNPYFIVRNPKDWQ